MRIAYLHQYYKTPDMVGGTRSFEMARRFSEAGHEVHVIAASSSGGRKIPRWTHEMVGDVHVHWLPVSYDNSMGTFRRLIAFAIFAILAGWKAGRVRPGVIFATSTPLTIAIPAAVAKVMTKAPIVFEVRDLWPEMPIALGALKDPLSKFLARRLELFAYRNSREIVALSPGMAAGVIERGVPADRVHVIPNSCDLDLFNVEAKAGQEYRIAQGIDPAVDLVVYCGTFGRLNDVGYLARLAAEFAARENSTLFLAVGQGADFAGVEAEARELGVLGKNFFLRPSVPKKDIPAILSAATVSCSLFLPLTEMESNSANKFFDTLASGTPAVLNYGGWQASLVEEAGAGVRLVSNDMSQAAVQLMEFLSDGAALERNATAAATLARSRFDRDELGAELISVLERACPPPYLKT